MMKEFLVTSRKLGRPVTLTGKEFVNDFDETFLNVTLNSLEDAYKEAVKELQADIHVELIATNATGSFKSAAFQAAIWDKDGKTIPVIGEADEAFVSEFWVGKIITLAQMRCIARCIIKYLAFDTEYVAVYGFCESAKGEEKAKKDIEEEIKNDHIPTMEEIEAMSLNSDAAENPAEETAETEAAAEPTEETSSATEAADEEPGDDETIPEEIARFLPPEEEYPDDEPSYTGSGIRTEDLPPTEEEMMTYAATTAVKETVISDATETVTAEPDLGETPVTLGKYKTAPSTLKQVYESDRSWLEYIVSGKVAEPKTEAGKQFLRLAKKYYEQREADNG